MKKNKRNETAAAEAVAGRNAGRAVKREKSSHNKRAADKLQNEKMTIYEYEEKYVKRQNTKGATFFLRLIVALIGVFFAWCFFSVSKTVWDVNEYAGYAAAGVSVILFIIIYIVPVVKILKSDYFITNVNYKTAAAAKRKNRKLRFDIATKIVDLCNTVAGVGWYDSLTVEKLEAGVKYHDDEVIKEQLAALYNGSVKKSARDVIFKCSMKAAMFSALSQESKIDSMLVATVNLQMIKDIVFLYGFRPSDTKLLKIFAAVVRNALIAYGLGGLKIGNGIARTVGDAAKGIPFLGSVISVLVDSSVQGLANGTLSAVIGYQTIKYLNTEYKLQNILDGIEVAETEEELAETCEDIEKELRKNGKRGGAIPV
ncbi:MAG: YcjF family protein [Clostridia bacterium]|nr:YcjF family protein [Clostridia bacterium]